MKIDSADLSGMVRLRIRFTPRFLMDALIMSFDDGHDYAVWLTGLSGYHCRSACHNGVLVVSETLALSTLSLPFLTFVGVSYIHRPACAFALDFEVSDNVSLWQRRTQLPQGDVVAVDLVIVVSVGCGCPN